MLFTWERLHGTYETVFRPFEARLWPYREHSQSGMLFSLFSMARKRALLRYRGSWKRETTFLLSSPTSNSLFSFLTALCMRCRRDCAYRSGKNEGKKGNDPSQILGHRDLRPEMILVTLHLLSGKNCRGWRERERFRLGIGKAGEPPTSDVFKGSVRFFCASSSLPVCFFPLNIANQECRERDKASCT